MNRCLLLCLGLASPAAVFAVGKGDASFYDRHVIFANSPSNGGYESSEGYVVPPSTLELSGGTAPVATDRFVSPPNALRLAWRSAPGGDWRITIEITRRYARPFRFEGEALTFWCYSDTEITAASAPRVYLKDVNENGTPAVPLVSGDERIPAGRWVQVQLPFADMLDRPVKGTNESAFDLPETLSVSFI